jgi:uncharacterized damage-inducible protein DinB
MPKPVNTQHFLMFAGYNAWANARLYDAVACMTKEEFWADRGAFFRSIGGTLNHLLVTDQVWMHRFTGSGTAPDRLDTVLFESLTDLRATREEEDRRIIAYVQNLSELDLGGCIRYRRVSTPEIQVQALSPALAHWFNHQTHHRGQAHALITGLKKPAPELDLLFYQRMRDAGPE